MSGSRYPGRPDHPDFWLLSQTVLDLDAQAETAQPFEDLLGRYLNPDSVIYMSRQRALRARQLGMVLNTEARLAWYAAAWVDGLIIGMAVQHLKAYQAAARGEEEAPDRGKLAEGQHVRVIAPEGHRLAGHPAVIVRLFKAGDARLGRDNLDYPLAYPDGQVLLSLRPWPGDEVPRWPAPYITVNARDVEPVPGMPLEEPG